MKRLALAAALGLAASVSAQAETLHCDLRSDYDFSQQGRTLIFSKAASPGKRIMIQDGRLIVDGKDQVLSIEDKQRVTQFENEMRLLIPQVKQVAIEATDIAFTALIEVSHAINGSQDHSTAVKLEKARIKLHASINKDPSIVINDDIGEQIIEPVLADFVPDVISAAIKQGLSIAFSGDDKKAKEFEARMDRLEKNLDAKIEVRAKKLEPLAQEMCSRVRNMDKIEDGITLRLGNHQQINLLETKAP